MTPRLLIIVALPAVALLAAPPPRPADTSPVPAAAGETPGLHNVHRLTAKVYSGATPEGDAGFASLRRLGVRTVLSVDGATPEVERAAAFGLRYVHLPVGYDGIPPAEVARLARAVRDLPGPVYVHCHHGQHRGPAAAAAALVCLGELSPAAATESLRVAGTDPRYKGLLALPQTTRSLPAADLDRVPADFPAAATTADLTRVMVKVDETWDRLTAGRDPAHVALQLEELYREAARLPAVAAKPDLAKRFAAAEAAARDLQAAPADKARQAASRRHCTQCHAAVRD